MFVFCLYVSDCTRGALIVLSCSVVNDECNELLATRQFRVRVLHDMLFDKRSPKSGDLAD